MVAALYPSSFAVRLIELYQRYLSPLKGFRCAHRARKSKKTSSCSQFAKRAIARLGIIAGWPLVERRFARCAASAKVLDYESRRKQTTPDQKRSSSSWSSCDPSPSCDVGDCGHLAECGSALPDACGSLDGVADVAACDWSL